MAGGWQLIPAIQGEGTGQDTSMMAQARKMSEPTWTQKEQYKQEMIQHVLNKRQKDIQNLKK